LVLLRSIIVSFDWNLCRCHQESSAMNRNDQLLAWRHSILILMKCLGVCAVMCRAVQAAPAALRVVARSGQLAPSAPGDGRFSTFQSAVIDNSGRVALAASIDTPTGGRFQRGIWTEAHGDALALVAIEGQHAPGVGPSGTFYKFGDMHVNENGQIAFTAQLRNEPSGLWLADVGGVQLVSQGDRPAPGLPAGWQFIGFEQDNASPWVTINADGKIAFAVGAYRREGGIFPTKIGLWTGDPQSGFMPAAIAGQQSPGFEPGVVFQDFDGINLDNHGVVTFRAQTSAGGGGVNGSENFGIWNSNNGAQPVLLVRDGEAAPGLPGFGFTRVHDPRASANGHVAFVAAAPARIGAWQFDASGTAQPILVWGQPAPGLPDETIDDVWSPIAVNNSGQLLVKGDASSTDAALWSSFRGNSPTLVAKELGPAPDTEDGVVFAESLSLTVPFSAWDINNRGQIAFQGQLQLGTGGVTSANDFGVWASDASSQIRLIAREGQQIELAPGDRRTYKTVRMMGFQQGGEIGGFNDNGQLILLATFTDDSWAVLVSNLVAVPEPSGAVLVVGLLGMAAMSRKRLTAMRRSTRRATR
jgi:hypothetical protein